MTATVRKMNGSGQQYPRSEGSLRLVLCRTFQCSKLLILRLDFVMVITPCVAMEHGNVSYAIHVTNGKVSVAVLDC